MNCTPTEPLFQSYWSRKEYHLIATGTREEIDQVTNETLDKMLRIFLYWQTNYPTTCDKREIQFQNNLTISPRKRRKTTRNRLGVVTECIMLEKRQPLLPSRWVFICNS